MPQTHATLQDKLETLFALRRERYDSTRINPDYFTLLERLGHTAAQLQHQLPPVIHVAGTNGKGSTIAFMRAILEEAGYSVHTHTSPHLLRFNERIVLNGQMIDDERLETLLDEVMEKSAGLDLHFLELTPALAFAAFARTRADVLLLETGLGGRLDHTNILAAPLATVITTLSFDHTDYLGKAIEQIATEKAGIMRAGVPCLIGKQIYPAAGDTLKAHAAAIKAPLTSPEDWDGDFILPTPALPGAHQIGNAMLAVETLRTQKRFHIPESAFAAGIKSAHWPARLQKIALPPSASGWELWLDGGHNDSAGLVLAEQAKDWAHDDRPLHIITGMMGNKDAVPFARALAPHAASVTTIDIPGHEAQCIPALELARIWREQGAKRAAADALDWDDILETLMEREKPGRILLTGSLYLAQMVL
jgi:dihydrofolate synthase/folylpolyglutamate synthase